MMKRAGHWRSLLFPAGPGDSRPQYTDENMRCSEHNHGPGCEGGSAKRSRQVMEAGCALSKWGVQPLCTPWDPCQGLLVAPRRDEPSEL